MRREVLKLCFHLTRWPAIDDCAAFRAGSELRRFPIFRKLNGHRFRARVLCFFRTVRFYMRLRLRGIAFAYAFAFLTFIVFNGLLIPTSSGASTISLTFLVSKSAFFAQTCLKNTAILLRPKLQNGVFDGAPFAGRQADNTRQFLVVVGKPAIVLPPCSNHQQQVCAMLLGGEVARVCQIVAAE